jgi:general secretion pathway protein N
MVEWRKLIGLAVVSGAVCLAPEAPAATSSTLDIISTDRAGDTSDTVDIGRVTPIVRSKSGEAGRPVPAGNPLWSVPLSALPATQERPIFSASRRPPQRAVVAPVQLASAPQPEKQAEQERLTLTLIGAVVGDNDAIAVFLDQASLKVVRLKQGDTHSGWVLSAVQGREVTLKKADRSETLVLQRPEAPSGAPPVSGQVVPGPVVPTAGGFDTSYAPFTPRSTPKNGESDGL